jgi:hypothetical protein
MKGRELEFSLLHEGGFGWVAKQALASHVLTVGPTHRHLSERAEPSDRLRTLTLTPAYLR